MPKAKIYPTCRRCHDPMFGSYVHLRTNRDSVGFCYRCCREALQLLIAKEHIVTEEAQA